MMALLQRVARAHVSVEGQVLGAIGEGLLVLVGVEKHDREVQARRLLQRITGYRVFADADGRMNRSLMDVGGELLLVPQFTLPADTDKGSRPSFSPAADPRDGRRLFDYLVEYASSHGPAPRTGCFGAHMQVHLVNDGPVTFMLRARPDPRRRS